MVARFSENTQRLQPMPNERFQAADFGSAGETIGRAVAQAGGAVMDFAQQQDQINARYDEAAAKQADADSMLEIAKIKGEALASEGFDAQSAVTTAAKEIERVGREREASLPNQRAQSMFKQVFQSRSASDLADLTSHATKQVLVANKAAAGARYQTYGEEAVNKAGTADFQAYVDTALGEIPSLFPGAGEDVLKQKRAEALSDIHVRAADAMIESDPIAAKDWVDRHAGQILSSDETKIRQKLQPGYEEAELDAAMGMTEELLASGRVRAGEGPDDDVEVAPSDLANPKEASESRRASAEAAADPLRGKGRVSETPENHVKRGRLAIDYAAPAGTPIYSTGSGKITETGYDPKGNGYFVRVQHPNGNVSTYLHMRGASALKAGDEVSSSTVIGSVGSTGHSTGNHLDYSIRNAAGNAIDPRHAVMEEDDLPAYRPERNDKAAMYAAARDVATKLNMGRKQYDGLLRRVDTVVAREDNLRARAREDQADAVWGKIAELGDGFTSITQLGGSYASLDPKEKLAIQNRMEQNQKGTEPPAGGQDYFDLLEASLDPSKQGQFAGVDLRRVNGITKGERASLMRSQAAITDKEGKAGTQTAAQYGRIYTALGRLDPTTRGYATGAKMSEIDRQRQTKLFERVRDEVDRRQEAKGSQLTDQEMEGIVKNEVLAVTVVKPGRLWGESKVEKPAYLADDVADAARKSIKIPVSDRNQIVASYQRRHNGQLPTEGEIARAYRSTLQAGR